MNPEGWIARHKMACYNSDSKAIVITINCVQTFTKSPFHGNSFTDPTTLSRMYNDDNVRLDIAKISALKNNQIHVGLEYFILTNGFRYRGRIKKFAKFTLKNLAHFIDFWGYKIFGKKRFLVKLGRRIKNRFFWIFRDSYYRRHKDSYPVILTTQESLEKLKAELKSFCRIGDGESAITMGNDIAFQKFDRRLADSLTEIISLNFDNIIVGLPYAFFYEDKNFQSSASKFGTLPIHRDTILGMIKKNSAFIDTCITLAYQTYETYDFASHFQTWKKIFAGRKILLVSGLGILDKLRYKYEIFEQAECLENIYAPAKNAYSELANIIREVLKYPTDYVVCIILGPAAKPMVVDLTRRGYIACDIGHLLKDYDAYMNKVERTPKQSAEFFAPE